jgi:hypothetical protein
LNFGKKKERIIGFAHVETEPREGYCNNCHPLTFLFLGHVIKLLSKNKLGTQTNIDGCAFGLHKNQNQNFDRLLNIILLELKI